jgi:hypothetical protein
MPSTPLPPTTSEKPVTPVRTASEVVRAWPATAAGTYRAYRGSTELIAARLSVTRR